MEIKHRDKRPQADRGRRLFERELTEYSRLDTRASDISAYLDEYLEIMAENE